MRNNFVIVLLSLLIFSVSSIGYRFSVVEIIPHNQRLENIPIISESKSLDLFFQEQKNESQNQFRLRETQLNFPFKLTAHLVQIKSVIIAGYSIKFFNNKLTNHKIFKDFMIVFPFHYFY